MNWKIVWLIILLILVLFLEEASWLSLGRLGNAYFSIGLIVGLVASRIAGRL